MKMKSMVCVLLAVVFCLATERIGVARSVNDAEDTPTAIAISGAWALYPMAVRWAEEFQKIYPQVKIDIAAGGAGKGIADALMKVADIGMVSRDISIGEVEKGAWFVAVVKDAVVPTVNANNPILTELLAVGVKKSSLVDLWISGRIKTWKELAGHGNNTPIHLFTRSDSCGAAETWAAFLGKNQEDLLGVGVYGDPGVAEAVRRDVRGIGFNNVNYVYDTKTKRQITDLRVLPIDLDENGRIDGGENFYGSRDELVRAVAAGKYPSPPARNLYLVSQGKPGKKAVRDFLKWVLTEGQKYVPETGYVNLSGDQLKKELAKLRDE